MKRFRLRNKIRKDEKGALEGLPLYLIILVVITAIAIVIIITWLSTMQEPDLDSLEVDTGTVDGTLTDKNSDSYTITITAKGTNGKGLEGVSVKLEGAGIAKTLKTGDGGKVQFTGIDPELPPNTYTGSITVTATYTGNIMVTKTTDIPVNKE